MRSCVLLVAGVAATLRPPASAQETAYPTTRIYAETGREAPDHPLDILHMRVEVRFRPEEKLVLGTVTHVFTPLRPRVDSLFFHGPGIRIRSATLDGATVRWKTSTEGVTVLPDHPLSWDRTDSITFAYEATPERGLYFVGWDEPGQMAPNKAPPRRQVWTQGQGIDNRWWIPCYDQPNDKMTTETIVTFDSAYRVLSNGTRVEVRDNGDGTRTWHYRMMHPHASYLVMLAIGRYAVREARSEGGVPLEFWYYPGEESRVGPTYLYSPDIVDFVARETGVPYPWESYAQVPVRDFLYGGMENTTATVYGDFLLVDARAFHDRNYIAVNAHEAAHQWFGDFVTAGSGKDTWLQESFATFYAKLFEASIFGEEWYEWARREEQNAALEASKLNRVPILHSAAGGARVYQKGSAILDMLMSVYGREEFRRVIAHYLRKHAYGNVETNDLYQAFQEVLGISPDWFFSEWITRGGEPGYSVGFEDITPHGSRERRSVFTVRQTQRRDDLVGLFRMPVRFEVHYADGSTDSTERVIEDECTVVSLPNLRGRDVAFALFDPGSRILKSVDFPKGPEMLMRQAEGAPLMIDRYDALVGLRQRPPASKLELLGRIFRRERFHAMREEVLAQCAGGSDPASLSLLREGLRDTEASVRGAALRACGPALSSLRSEAERLLGDSSYVNEEAALDTLCERFPVEKRRYLGITRNDQGTGHRVNILWHELNAQDGDTSSIAQLEEYTGGSHEFMTRVNAFAALKRLGRCDERMFRGLFGALVSPNSRLRGPAAEFAGYFMQQTTLRRKLADYYRSRRWREAERRLLEPLFH